MSACYTLKTTNAGVTWRDFGNLRHFPSGLKLVDGGSANESPEATNKPFTVLVR